MVGARIVELDVRPQLRKKQEPFKLIMEAVASLEQEDLFILHATFKPTPLFGIMKSKGYTHKAEEIDPEYWIIAFAQDAQAENQLTDLQLQDLVKQEEEEEQSDE